MPRPLLARLRALTAPPVFPGDEETSLQARQLHMITLGGAAAITLWAPGVALAVPDLRPRAAAALSMLALFAFAFALNQARRVRLGSTVLVGGLWVLMTTVAWAAGAVRETSFGWHFLVVLMAALLLGRRAAFGLLVVSVATQLILMDAQRKGLAPPMLDSMPAVVVAHVAILALSLTLLYTATRTISDTLTRTRRGEAALRALLDATTDPAFLMKADGTLLALNGALARSLGGDARAMVDRNVWSFVPAELAAARRARVDEVMRSGHPVRFEDRGASGRVFDNNVFPVKDDLGRTVRVAVFARDVTDFREAQAASERSSQELQRAYARVARLDKAKSDFITVTAHELRTPLTLVMGYAELLEEATRETPGASSLVGGVRTGARRLHRIIDDMLDLITLERDTPWPAREPVALGALAAEVLLEFERGIEERKLTVVCQIGELPAVPGDAEALSKALHHLVMNAIKFTPDGGRITLRGRTRADAGRAPAVELVVEDTGIGIDRADQERIFESFSQTGDVRFHSSSRTRFKGGGPGLGLALAKKVVEAHGGRLWVESPGHDEVSCPGSRFFLVLPLEAPPGG
ncbi:MAG TPA: PAS domain-containing sensor histidine kinase [Vicinamibacteria bacterium]|nr:PAS domain-containing sensor histidine kinase [Vicinamibacteria bacterium]